MRSTFSDLALHLVLWEDFMYGIWKCRVIWPWMQTLLTIFNHMYLNGRTLVTVFQVMVVWLIEWIVRFVITTDTIINSGASSVVSSTYVPRVCQDTHLLICLYSFRFLLLWNWNVDLAFSSVIFGLLLNGNRQRSIKVSALYFFTLSVEICDEKEKQFYSFKLNFELLLSCIILLSLYSRVSLLAVI